MKKNRTQRRLTKTSQRRIAPSATKTNSFKPNWDHYTYKKTTLASGVRVVTERNPNAVSAAVGFNFGRGTRDEESQQSGYAHFLEHMLFKATERRSAYQISRDMEAVGSDINAFTSKEMTTFEASGLPNAVERSIEVLADIVCRPLFLDPDIETEKEVVLQEIRSSQDQLEDVVFEKHIAATFQGSELARPILGSVEAVQNINRKGLRQFYRRQFTNDSLVIVATGLVDHDEVCAAVEKWMTPLKGVARKRLPPGTTGTQIKVQKFVQVQKRSAEQAHLMLGLPWPSFRDHRRFAGALLNLIIGGGLTSRFYQEIREKRGLAYSVYSMLQTFVDAGTLIIYSATDPLKAPEAMEVSLKLLKEIPRSLNNEEFQVALSQMYAATVLSSDDPEIRMQSIAVNELVFGVYRPISDILKEYRRVKLEDIEALAQECLNPSQVSLSLLGPFPVSKTKTWINSIL